MENKFWIHNCKNGIGETATLKGESCNYCDVTEKDIELEDKDKDYLYDPEQI